MTVKSNIRKKLAETYKNSYYKSLDDGWIYWIQDLPIDMYFPSASSEAKDYMYLTNTCIKAQILHAGWRIKFVEGQHSTEHDTAEGKVWKKQHGNIKIYCDNNSEVTGFTVIKSTNLSPNLSHIDAEMFDKETLTGEKYNVIARSEYTTI